MSYCRRSANSDVYFYRSVICADNVPYRGCYVCSECEISAGATQYICCVGEALEHLYEHKRQAQKVPDEAFAGIFRDLGEDLLSSVRDALDS